MQNAFQTPPSESGQRSVKSDCHIGEHSSALVDIVSRTDADHISVAKLSERCNALGAPDGMEGGGDLVKLLAEGGIVAS